ncbi:hypothetical protein [Erythrobacter aureus]|uniref:Uncharacterized protein n=1 Tax=Erythrobacter aureus TaxID=2182384 RepID=A0A345YJL5_9SPHN|nr:hypothetical protein [Erythrobacter aureus]AXK44117.1 hypothetical protein DVR09_16830 [Erythrobacter aureus]
MSNVLIAIATLTVGFILATYGAYTSYYSLKRAEYFDRVSTGFELAVVYVTEMEQDLGRVPVAADLDPARFADLEGHGIVYRYGSAVGWNGKPYVWVCARAPVKQPYIEEAFQKVADQRTGTLFGPNCQNWTGSGASVAITYRLNEV